MYSIKERETMRKENYLTPNKKWAEEQLKAANYSTNFTKDLALALLDVIADHNVEPKQIETVDQVFDFVKKLYKGEPIHVESNKDETWVDVRVGDLALRDRIRVKVDAYKGNKAEHHNGKTGVVVRANGERISIRYDGEGVDTITQHGIDLLERPTP